MPNRTEQPPPQPTPVIAARGAAAAELHARAADDYAAAQAHRDRLSHEDRVHGNGPTTR
ncbi:hypothetical protein [Streptomyces sp. NPDC053367]|uniref:hypothetical protein n=1 Tax=Streptomyces sp. NPDC053367 TaxID=3365700 RepID=UPI0037D2EAA5